MVNRRLVRLAIASAICCSMTGQAHAARATPSTKAPPAKAAHTEAASAKPAAVKAAQLRAAKAAFSEERSVSAGPKMAEPLKARAKATDPKASGLEAAQSKPTAESKSAAQSRSALARAALTRIAAAKADRAQNPESAMPARECMARAMYFESDRTREDGMLAVGTVVANRLKSGRYGDNVCAVVGRRAQFAPGVLTRAMIEARVAEKARRVADAVLAGERHPIAGDAMFFHTANVPFRHDDKRYILVSGGNAFYAWNRRDDDETERANLQSLRNAFASSERDRLVGRQVVALAMLGEPRAPSDRPIAPEIITPAPDLLARAIAYREETRRTPAASAALAAVSNLKPSPRVIEPSAPVLASSGPVWSAPAAKTSAAAAMLNRANLVVARAWNVIAGLESDH